MSYYSDQFKHLFKTFQYSIVILKIYNLTTGNDPHESVNYFEMHEMMENDHEVFSVNYH